jgi:hypothetical protein
MSPMTMVGAIGVFFPHCTDSIWGSSSQSYTEDALFYEDQ